MTHLHWRNGRAYFRYRLPPGLRAIPKPPFWPHELDELVSEAKPHQLKHELSKALRTRDERQAKREAARLIGWAEDLVGRGLALLRSGPSAALSVAEVQVMAARYGAGLIAGDMELRKEGIGLRFRPLGDRFRIGPPPPAPPRQPGLTDDDFDLLKYVVERTEPELREAVARQRPISEV